MQQEAWNEEARRQQAWQQERIAKLEESVSDERKRVLEAAQRLDQDHTDRVRALGQLEEQRAQWRVEEDEYASSPTRGNGKGAAYQEMTELRTMFDTEREVRVKIERENALLRLKVQQEREQEEDSGASDALATALEANAALKKALRAKSGTGKESVSNAPTFVAKNHGKLLRSVQRLRVVGMANATSHDLNAHFHPLRWGNLDINDLQFSFAFELDSSFAGNHLSLRGDGRHGARVC